MNRSDPNREQVVTVARALARLSQEVVFVGGATVGLLITDPASPSVRPTLDVDVIVEVASYLDYQQRIAPDLKRNGLVEFTEPGAPICAWLVGGVRVDVMPTEATVLGFTNPWYKGAILNAQSFDLDGTAIQLITAPYFLATKLVAFAERGEGDYYGSHDLEDILAVIDGRATVVEEVANSDDMVRGYLKESVAALLAENDFLNAAAGHVEIGRADILLTRLRAIVGKAGN